ASVAAAASSKSSMSNGPSRSSATGFSTEASGLRRVPTDSGASTGCSLGFPLPNAISRAAPRHRFVPWLSQTRVSAGGAVAAVATCGLAQSSLVERGHLDQIDQLDALHQQLGDPV